MFELQFLNKEANKKIEKWHMKALKTKNGLHILKYFLAF
jgi:hypothetical protein